MANRFVLINALRLVLLIVFLVSDDPSLRAATVIALVATLVYDVIQYRKEKAVLEAESEADPDSGHVPLPPQYRDR